MKRYQSTLTSTVTHLALTFSALLLSSSLALAAEDAHHADSHGDSHGDSHDDSHGANNKHIFGVFIGATRDAADETDSTAGIEYEYKFNRRYGIGAVYEKTPDAHSGDGITVYLASLYVHPVGGLRLGLGSGYDVRGGTGTHRESLTRLSAVYDFHIKGFGVAPTLCLDRVDGEQIQVFGVAISKSF